MDWDEGLKDLKKLMEEGKISISENIAPEFKKVMYDRITGSVKEETISQKLKEAILELRGKGE